MADHRVQCQVFVPESLESGPLVNAFRAIQDGRGWMLDFLVHNPEENKAVVIYRVRVTQEFMAAVRDRLDSTLQNITSAAMGNVVEFPLAGGGRVH